MRPAEMIDEYGHSLYSARMFYHKRLVGDEYQAAYHAARESEEYEVSFEADYDTGDLTITVEAVP